MRYFFVGVLATVLFPLPAQAQTGRPGLLGQKLLGESAAGIAEAVRNQGDPARGAVLFHQSYLACRKCHTVDGSATPLGPNLTRPKTPLTIEHIVEAVLEPSKKISQGYETITVITDAGKTITGLVVRDTDKQLVLREAAGDQQTVTIPKESIEAQKRSPNSLMPIGLANQLSSRQQFVDLVRYVWEIAEQGPKRALQLTPPPGSYATRPLPEYEKRIDHAGILRDLDGDAFKRGQAIYQRLCINCHGDQNRPGSLPTSLRFATGKFKNGADPYTMYRTLTRGFGMMQPQMWMVPQQKYDVIHYIREAYLKRFNSTQHVVINERYLASLPVGGTRGPAPTNVQEWVNMDYGPSLIHTYEFGNSGDNIAYKGIAIRLDEGPGGVSRGGYWAVYDEDTMRLAGAWTGKGFIDWNGIMFNGRHGIHPRVQGRVHITNPTGPGWSPNGSFDAPRVIGRDDKPYGPLPKTWAHYKGLYHHGQRALLEFSVGDTKLLESPAVRTDRDEPVFLRHLSIGARKTPLTVQVATHPNPQVGMTKGRLDNSHSFVTLGAATTANEESSGPLKFDGSTHLSIANGGAFDMTNRDFSITARIQTRKGGTILAKTAPQSEWVRDGKSLFIRGGRLVYDIGWVGAVQSKKRVDDGRPHDVAMTWNQEEGRVRLFVDGKLEGQGTLKPKGAAANQIVRVGYTSANFPPDSGFQGGLSNVRFYQRALSATQTRNPTAKDAIAAFALSDSAGNEIRDITGKVVAKVIRGEQPTSAPTALDVGVWPETSGIVWKVEKGALRATIPAGDKPLNIAIWMRSRQSDESPAAAILGLTLPEKGVDLRTLTKGGPQRWPQPLVTKAILGSDKGPLAADVLTRPSDNPWLARVRPTGLDFEAGGDRMIVSTWDGDIWRVSGVKTPEKGLTWKRIGSGLFQPLGVKIVDGKIFVTCRDQLCILHDLNDDGEIDYYENFNNDHQVTEHFHEFAMGLQTDADGNFYYAKSARHALKAVVPHHGTLLRVSKDGQRTDIVATGFRAANGVCINPDGTFIVTDQEGHWNPKNRINWVKPGGFYGNMFGYHDVTDSSDEAMEPPLCWITNSFDRSPSELLWVDSERWGPLNGALLNFSYGYGKVYVVPHEKIDGQIQGGMCELPLPQFPTGVMRGRFHPDTGQLYACGMFAWAGNQQQPGGLYRIRMTGKPIYTPLSIRAKRGRLELPFSEPLDPKSVNADNVSIETWGLRRTANYGSKHYNQKPLTVAKAELDADGKTVILHVPDVRPTWCMSVRFSFVGESGAPARGVIHNTIHKLGD